MQRGCGGLSDQRQAVAGGFARLLPFVDVCEEVDIWNVAIEDRASSFDHAVCELRRDPRGVAEISLAMIDLRYAPYFSYLSSIHELKGVELTHNGAFEDDLAPA